MKVEGYTEADLIELLPFLKPEELAGIDELLMVAEDWEPQDGPQTMAYESQADILGYGGASGGAKTDLMLGVAHQKHMRSVIFRHDYTQFEQIEERLQDLLGHIGRYNSTKFRWRFSFGGYKRSLELGAVHKPGAERSWQGRPHDFIGFDEVTHFGLQTVQYLTTWLRSTIAGQRCRIIMTFNPPESAEGRWVIEYFAPWLDKKHPNPAKPGELRWFVSNEAGEDIEVSGPDPVRVGHKYATPKSRTFIPAKVKDNKYLAGTAYEATLDALPEPLLSQMRDGDFQAGMQDDQWQVIPTDWVEAAQARWVEKEPDKRGPMDALGVDVARGGRDKTVLTPRHGTWFGQQKCHPGMSTPDGQAVIGLVIDALGGITAPVQIDVLGIGSSPTDIGKMNNLEIVAMDGSRSSVATDRSGKLRFANLRAEWHWKLREDLDPNLGSNLALPPDRELKADLCAPRWKMTSKGIQVELKDDIKSRIKRSPDKGESLLYAHAQTDAGIRFAVPFVTGRQREIPGGENNGG